MALPEHPEWTEEFSRLVLVSAVESAWPSRRPGHFSPQLFGALDGGSRTTPPRTRIARVVDQCWTKTGSQPPGVVMVAEMLRQELQALPSAERGQVWAEWEACRQVWTSQGTEWIEDEVHQWVQWKRLTATILQAGDLLARGPRAAHDTEQLLTRILQVDELSEDHSESQLIADVDERLTYWAHGDAAGDRIPTGFEQLDTMLSGGPARGEVFYVLAPPKGAKTTVLLKIALAAVRQRFGVYMASFEMRAKRVLYRADRGVTRASPYELQQNPSLLTRAIRGLQASSEGELTVWEASPQLPRACDEVARRINKRRKQGQTIDVVVFDYLNIMGSSRNEREKRHELARTSREMSALGKNEGVVVWSAALVKREAVNKLRPSKTDIAEAFEVIAVLDGAITVFGNRLMLDRGFRGLYATAIREAEDERTVGVFKVDLARLAFDPLDQVAAGQVLREKEDD